MAARPVRPLVPKPPALPRIQTPAAASGPYPTQKALEQEEIPVDVGTVPPPDPNPFLAASPPPAIALVPPPPVPAMPPPAPPAAVVQQPMPPPAHVPLSLRPSVMPFDGAARKRRGAIVVVVGLLLVVGGFVAVTIASQMH